MLPPRRRRHRRRISRKLLIWIGSGVAAAILLPIAAVVLLIATIDPNSYKAQVEASLRHVLGRDLRIRGGLSVSASLTPTIEADDVTLANMPTGSRADMVRIDHVQLQLATRALFTGRLVVSRIALTRPDILLETDAAGHSNWTWRPAPAKGSNPGERADLALLTLHIRDGHLTWRDGRSGAVAIADLRRLSLTSASLDSPIVLGAELVYDRHHIDISAQTGPWARLMNPAARTPWGLFVNVENAGAKLTVTGSLTRPDELRGYSLRLDAAVPDLGALAWLLPWKLPPLRNLTVTARVLDTGGEWPDLSGVVIQSGFTNLDQIAGGLSLDSVRIEMPRLSDPVVLTAEGNFASGPLRLTGTLGPPALLLPGAPAGQGYNVDIKAEAAGATFAARGAIAEPTTGKGMDIAVGARIPDLAVLAPLTGMRLPLLRTVAFAGQLTDGAGGYKTETLLRDIVLTMPQGDLSGEIGVDWGARPRLRAVLKAGLIDADGLRVAWTASASEPIRSGRRPGGLHTLEVITPPPLPRLGGGMIPDDKLPLGLLRAFDADMRARVSELRAGGLTYHDITASAVLSGGRLVLDPVAGGLGGGRAELRLALDAAPAAPPVTLALRAQGIDLKPLAASWGLPVLVGGRLDLDAELKSAGASWHALAAGADGRVLLDVTDGEFDTRAAGGTLRDVLHAIRNGNQRLDPGVSHLRCLALDAGVAGGAVTLAHAGIDIGRAFATAAGEVDLGGETYALRLRPYLRSGNNALAAPLRLDGNWRGPTLAPDPLPAGTRPPADACAGLPPLRPAG